MASSGTLALSEAERTFAYGLRARLRGAWKRLLRFERQSSMTGPALFAVVAGALLVYNHTEQQVTDLVFWLGLGLIGAVFIWMLENNFRQSRVDRITGLYNRLQLQEDLAEIPESRGDHRTLMLLELDGLGAYKDRRGFEASDVLLKGFAGELSGIVEQLGGMAYRIDDGHFCALVPAAGRQPGEIVMAILGSTEVESGDKQIPIYRPHGSVTLPDEAPEHGVALKLASERLAVQRERQRRSAKRQAADVLVSVLTARRPELDDHIRSVAFRTISVGRALDLGEGQLDDVVTAARLQNIGLMAVPDSVLDKEGSLTEEEAKIIRRHPAAGAAIIAASPALASVAGLVRSSCEHFDGHGYPEGLSGENIPLGSRIVAVCVAFTALTSPRPHRPASTDEEALAILRSCAGAQFDPEVVEALAEDLGDELETQLVQTAGNGSQEGDRRRSRRSESPTEDGRGDRRGLRSDLPLGSPELEEAPTA
jgi:HD-GYP domain-containing protein (c-di-GMP phosphodiesterase class II)